MRLFPYKIGQRGVRKNHFNTTKVRLFPIGSARVRIDLTNFNTTKVRLFLLDDGRAIDGRLHFNTTKVRLFPTEEKLCANRSGSFQYHKGAIISQPKTMEVAMNCFISIPQRCDYFAMGLNEKLSRYQLSIPQRCDYFREDNVKKP